MNTIAVTKDEMPALIVKATPDFEPIQACCQQFWHQVLGLIPHKVTGKSYREAFKKSITLKIGLADTYLATGNMYASKNVALTDMNFGDGWKTAAEIHPNILFSAGAIISTPQRISGSHLHAASQMTLLDEVKHAQ